MNMLQESAQCAILPVLAVKGGHLSVSKGSFGEQQSSFRAIGGGQSNLTALTVAHFWFRSAEPNVAVRDLHNVWSMIFSVDSNHYAYITDVTGIQEEPERMLWLCKLERLTD